MTRLIDLPEMIVRDVAALRGQSGKMLRVSPEELDRIVTSRVAEIADRALEAIGQCAACIPSNWLDPLLSGPKKIAEFPSCPDVEKLLNAIRERILALAMTERGGR